MATRVGVDGCRAGWVAVLERDAALVVTVVPTVGDLLDAVAGDGMICIDIPIGLPETGSRACDLAARKRLAARRNSVFPAPLRPALAARSRAEADAITRRIDGRGVAAQAFGIYAKIREVDAALRARPGAQGWVREVHPELCFAAWNGRPMAHPKKRSEGRAARLELVEAVYGAGAYASARARYRKKEVADDDLLDAFAALWSARRVEAGRHGVIPDRPPTDAVGLRMEMVY